MKVFQMQRQHVDQVARLHSCCLRTRFQGASGERLLRSYYSAVVEGRGACGYVATSEDNRVVGFVCGIWDAGQLQRRMVKRHAPWLAWNALAFGLARPSVIFDLLGRLVRTGDPEGPFQTGYELRPIVVAEEARRCGVAGLLVDALLKDAAARNFSSIDLVTEADNLPARNFYRKVGFEEMGNVYRDGSTYIRYVRKTAVPL